MTDQMWTFEAHNDGRKCTAALVAVWEVAFDPISDEFTPDETSAEELFQMWVRKVSGKYADDLIPIYWFVDVSGDDISTFEGIPFAVQHDESVGERRDFLTFFTWPESVQTGDPLRWMELPVIDKLWNDSSSNKGGFIQEYTGWKPSVLQPHVSLSSLQRSVA